MLHIDDCVHDTLSKEEYKWNTLQRDFSSSARQKA